MGCVVPNDIDLDKDYEIKNDNLEKWQQKRKERKENM